MRGPLATSGSPWKRMSKGASLTSCGAPECSTSQQNRVSRGSSASSIPPVEAMGRWSPGATWSVMTASAAPQSCAASSAISPKIASAAGMAAVSGTGASRSRAVMAGSRGRRGPPSSGGPAQAYCYDGRNPEEPRNSRRTHGRSMMRKLQALAIISAAATALALPSAHAQEAFDACNVFTAADAESALGTAAAAEPVNPKVKRPKVVLNCTYTGFKENKPVAAAAQYKFSRNDAEAQRAFDEARLQFQTKPLFISGAEAFWSGKTGQLNVRKGRAWIVLSVGPQKVNERDIEQAKKLAEILVKKL